MLLPLAMVLGLTGSSYVLGPAVSERHALVRLRVRTNSGVKVPIGQSTGCP